MPPYLYGTFRSPAAVTCRRLPAPLRLSPALPTAVQRIRRLLQWPLPALCSEPTGGPKKHSHYQTRMLITPSLQNLLTLAVEVIFSTRSAWEAETSELVLRALPTEPFGHPNVEPYADPYTKTERRISRALGATDKDVRQDVLLDGDEAPFADAIVQQHVAELRRRRDDVIREQSSLPEEERLLEKSLVSLRYED